MSVSCRIIVIECLVIGYPAHSVGKHQQHNCKGRRHYYTNIIGFARGTTLHSWHGHQFHIQAIQPQSPPKPHWNSQEFFLVLNLLFDGRDCQQMLMVEQCKLQVGLVDARNRRQSITNTVKLREKERERKKRNQDQKL